MKKKRITYDICNSFRALEIIKCKIQYEWDSTRLTKCRMSPGIRKLQAAIKELNNMKNFEVTPFHEYFLDQKVLSGGL